MEFGGCIGDGAGGRDMRVISCPRQDTMHEAALGAPLVVGRDPQTRVGEGSETVETAGDPNGPMWRIRRLKGTSGPRCQRCIWIDMGGQAVVGYAAGGRGLLGFVPGMPKPHARHLRQPGMAAAEAWALTQAEQLDWRVRRGQWALGRPAGRGEGLGMGQWAAGVPAAGQDMPGFICAAHGLA